MSFQIGKTIFRQKKPHFPSSPPVKWISGTPFSLPSPPLPLLSRSLEHSVDLTVLKPKTIPPTSGGHFHQDILTPATPPTGATATFKRCSDGDEYGFSK
ncbi:hypothetical protein Hanom_Chr11g01037911 [Helianthus anomalus]